MGNSSWVPKLPRSRGDLQRTGALKIFNNISAQFLVESFKEMDNYKENTYTFWLYIFDVRNDPCCPEEIILQKANILVGDAKGTRQPSL